MKKETKNKKTNIEDLVKEIQKSSDIDTLVNAFNNIIGNADDFIKKYSKPLKGRKSRLV